MNLFFRHATAVLGERFCVEQTNIRVEQDTIVGIGSAVSAHDGDEIIDASRLFVIPGLVNAHLHPTHTLSKGVTDGVTWKQGLDRLYRLDVQKNDQDRFWASLLAYAEALFSGTTTVSVLTSNIEGEHAAAEDIGIRAFLSKAYHDTWQEDSAGPHLTPLANVREDFERMHKQFSSELVDIHIGIGIEMAASRELFLLTKELAERFRIRVNAHTAEHRDMIRDFKKRHGMHPVLYYRDIGFLGSHLTLIHMTQIDRADVLDALQESGTHIAHCPVANAKLTDGFLPLADVRRRKITVGLGTDASMNSNTNNMLSEMYIASLLHNSRTNRPDFLSARDVLRMATIDSARTIGADELVGSIEKGKRADLAIFDLDSIGFTPSYDPISNLVYNSPDIRARHTIVNGKFAVRDYRLQTSDLREILQEVTNRSENIRASMHGVENPVRTTKVYIAGSFTNLKDTSKVEFMKNMAKVVEDVGLEAIVPYPLSNPDYMFTLSPEEIYEVDTDHVSEVDVVVAYVGAPSLGTGMEIMLAKVQQKPIILVYEKGYQVSRMVLGAVPRNQHVEFETEEEALVMIGAKLKEVV